MDKAELSLRIKEKASFLGFNACGIARSDVIARENKTYLRGWLDANKHAGMEYMGNHFEKRCDPKLLVEGTQSIISVALNYFPEKKLNDKQLQFAYYAYGTDYHEVMKKKLSLLLNYIIEEVGQVSGRAFCDTAPVLERFWAQQAGLGWIGKNTQLIITGKGSYFFLGEIFLDIELKYDAPATDHCGNCRRCLEVCPTNALERPHLLNANKCLSYLTIENKGEISKEFISKLGPRLYGCDECQKACPWNRFSVSTQISELQPSAKFMAMQPSGWNSLTIEEYRTLFKGSAVKRAKYEGLMRNLKAITMEEENRRNKEESQYKKNRSRT